MGCRLLTSGMACYGREECMECLGQGLLGCKVGGGYLVLYEGVKDFVGKDGVVIIQMASGYMFPVNVKPLNCVQMCLFSLVMQHLHNVADGAKGM